MSILSLRNEVGTVYDGGDYTYIHLNNCTNVTIKNINVIKNPTNINDQAVRVYKSPGTRLENLDIKLITGPDLAMSGEGININASDNTVVYTCKIDGSHQGITFGYSKNLVLKNNVIINTRTSPISGAPEKSMRIVENYIGASHPLNWGKTGGDHADMIHLFTVVSVDDIWIRGNTLDQTGGEAILGINLQNKVGNFTNMLVDDNYIACAQGQAIVSRGAGGVFSNNVLVALGAGKNTAQYRIYSPYSPLLLKNNIGPIALDPKMAPAQRALITIQP